MFDKLLKVNYHWKVNLTRYKLEFICSGGIGEVTMNALRPSRE